MTTQEAGQATQRKSSVLVPQQASPGTVTIWVSQTQLVVEDGQIQNMDEASTIDYKTICRVIKEHRTNLALAHGCLRDAIDKAPIQASIEKLNFDYMVLCALRETLFPPDTSNVGAPVPDRLAIRSPHQGVIDEYARSGHQAALRVAGATLIIRQGKLANSSEAAKLSYEQVREVRREVGRQLGRALNMRDDPPAAKIARLRVLWDVFTELKEAKKLPSQ